MSNYAAYAVFERLSLQCLAVFRFIRVLPCKETFHMNAPKIFKAQLLHTSPPFCLSNPMSPLEMSNAWHRVALEFAKRKHLNWSWYEQLLLSPLSSTPESTPYSRQLLCWTISRHLSEKLPLSGHLGDRCPLCRIIQHQPDSTGNFSSLLRRHQT